MMTFDEVVAVGREKLIEYEPLLNVKGQRQYSATANCSLQRRYECSLSTLRKEDVERVVSDVLERLVDLKDGFVMSGPQYLHAPPNIELGVAAQNDLSLSFIFGYDIETNKQSLSVLCWYYPAD